jgi:hypothetical protein
VKDVQQVTARQLLRRVYEKQGQEIQAARAQAVAERSQISKMQKAQK